jgi:hypothetical protein
LHYLVHGVGGFEAAAVGSCGQLWVFLPALAVGVVAHEAVHGLGWMVAGRVPFRAMRFGFRSLTPFAHCTVPLPARAYRIGIAAPGVLVGLLPALLGTTLSVGGLAAFGWLLTGTAGGDLLVLWLLRGVPPGAMVEDHPTRAGCLVNRTDLTGPNP